MAKLFNGALIAYGPILPATGTASDGALFYKTDSLIGGSKGLYVYGFSPDTSAAFGQQVAQGWMKTIADNVDADTLDGLNSTDFQRYDLDLLALANTNTSGIYIRTGNGTSATRTISPASSRITIVNGDGVAGNPSIDVSEANLVLNNIGGTLTATKGGTGNTGPFFTGGVLYAAGSTGPLNCSEAGTSGQVLLSSGAASPVWASQSALSVGFATNAASAASATNATNATNATYATTSGTANSVAWTNVTGKPTTVAGSGLTDAVNQEYVDTADYLNLPPLAGVLKDNTVPLYSDFKFSQGTWNDATFGWVDREGKQVLFYGTNTPTGYHSSFRAYRFSDSDAFIYDNEPTELTFMLPTEKVRAIFNMGTTFAVVQLCTVSFPETITRVVMVRTYGSSNWIDWTLAYDVTSLSVTYSNFSLVETGSGDRVLRMVFNNSTEVMTLEVYNSSLTLLRSQVLYTRSVDVNNADTTGAGRVVNSTALPLFNYSGYGTLYGFTWNPFTQSLHQHNSSYYTYTSSAGAQVGVGFGLSISWSVPKSWIESGSGSPTNLIPVKGSGFRYHRLSDSTWGTDDGGMADSWSIGGTNPSIITDEYSGQVYFSVKGSFDAGVMTNMYRLNSGYTYKTMGGNNSPRLSTSYTQYIPDGSPWSKTLYTFWGHVIGNNILMQARSTRYGIVYVQATFSTTSFASIAQGQTNDTLKLDSPTAIISPQTSAPASVLAGWAPGNFGVTVSAGTPTYYHTSPGQPVYTITASGAARTYTATGLTMPAIPTTIGPHSGLTHQAITAWNGSVGSPVFWAVVRASTNLVYMAKYSGGSWSIPAGTILQAEINYGNSARGDSANHIQFEYCGQALLTENGRFMFNFGIPVTGGTAWYWANYNVGSDVTATGTLGAFDATLTGAGGYSAQGGYPGATFGYSTTLGYYRYLATGIYDAAAFVSSRDVRTGATISEDQWYTSSATQYQIYITTESATGLVAYISSYPLFIGGYYCTTPTQSISLNANALNYVYAVKDPGDRSTVNIVVSTTLLPSSFTRVLLAAITTNATNIVSQVTYPVIQHDSVEELENVQVSSLSVNDALAWNGTNWTNLPVATTAALNAAIASAVASYVLKGGDVMTGLLQFPRSRANGLGSTGAPAFEVNDGAGYVVGGMFGYIGAPYGAIKIAAGAQNYTFDFNGTFTAPGNVVAYSDARIKQNVLTIQDPIDIVKQLRGVTYELISTGAPGVGVIAQEVKEVLPCLVHEAADGTLGVAYGNLVGVLIEAVKAQQVQIDELKAEVQRLIRR